MLRFIFMQSLFEVWIAGIEKTKQKREWGASLSGNDSQIQRTDVWEYEIMGEWVRKEVKRSPPPLFFSGQGMRSFYRAILYVSNICIDVR